MAKLNLERQSNKPKTERIRFLNVIYFIDSARTRTFKISLKSGIICAVILGTLIVWSFIGTILLISTSQESNRKSLRIRNLLSTIFNYQTRFDDVYELTYPKGGEISAEGDTDIAKATSVEEQTPDENTLLKTKGLSLAAKSPSELPSPHQENLSEAIFEVEDEEEEEEEEEEEDQIIADMDNQVSSESNQVANLTEERKPSSSDEKSPPIAIEEVKIEKSNDDLEFRFALRNLDSPNLASGFVAGAASFKTDQNDIVEIYSPAEIDLNKKVVFSKLSKNHRFSIRYYKTKILTFEKPKGKSGSFQKVRIVLGDKDGNRKEIMYNLKENAIVSIEDTSESYRKK